MSDDLISRKAVLEILYDISGRNYGSLFGHGINKACDVIKHAETAFDKEKVLKELAFLKEDAVKHEKHDFADAYELAIEIVEKGGIE